MATHRIVDVIDDQPTFDVPVAQIWAECEAGGAIKVLSPVEYHSDRQRKWYKGVCLRGLSDWNGETPEEWDARLKAECGGDELLKTEQIYMGRMSNGQPVLHSRRTIVGVGKKNMTAFIENILSKATTEDWPVTSPDPELRR